MMSSRNVLRVRWNFRAAIICALVLLTFLLGVASTGMAQGTSKTAAKIALYKGPDREQVLLEGAKKEGNLVLYTSNSTAATIIPEGFQKKYPFIKVSVGRVTGDRLLKRVMEEHAAGRNVADVIEAGDDSMIILYGEGLLQEYYFPDLSSYGDDVKRQGKTGVYFCGDREQYLSLGFNPKRVSPAEAPKTYKDLLDPKWKGKMTIITDTVVHRWIGNVMDEPGLGLDFLEKLSHQDLRVQNMTPTALADLVIAEEVPLSPTIFAHTVSIAKQKGAPIEWQPLEPVVAYIGVSGMVDAAPHPHAALLFLEYFHSKEGQGLVMQQSSSPRQDMAPSEKKFKKTYLGRRYPSPEVMLKKEAEWQSLKERFFIRKQ
jgi:iron(III) transport system substrate-binding protein